MLRTILILVIVLILLTILRSVVKKFRLNSPPPNIKQKGDLKGNMKTDNDDIVDAKFEELK